MILIAGGLTDPNLDSLAKAAIRLGVDWLDLRQPLDTSSRFHWELVSPLDSTALPWSASVFPTGAFFRHDVFAHIKDPRPEVATRALGWFESIQGWLLAHPAVRIFNRDISNIAHNKPATLMLAHECGLEIPRTWVSNHTFELKQRASREPSIAKPVAGGGYCHALDTALADEQAPFAAMPAIVQNKLISPEIRLFMIGEQAFAFHVQSPSLDYRVHQDAVLEVTDIPDAAEPLRTLMHRLGMNFGAADLKTDPETGRLVFMELNTSPMFAAFDRVSDGKLTESMVSYLVS